MEKIIPTLKKAWRETDKLLVILCIIASAFGCALVRSATEISRAENATFSRDCKTMIIAVTAGIVISLIISYINCDLIIRLWPLIAGACLFLMVLTLFIGVGPSARSDVRSWLVLPGGYYFQPSELVKIGFIITFAVHLDLVKDRIKEFKTVFLLCLHGAVPVLLVERSGDMGSALIFLIIFFVMLFMGGISAKHIALGVAVIIAAVPLAWRFVLGNIQKERIIALIHPDEYPDIIYQQDKSLTAIGSGGWFGMGYMQGEYTQRGVVPENENDMILSVAGEELGFIGCIAAILLLAFIIVKIIKTGNNSKDNATSLMCYGMGAMLAGHVIVNVGMCLMLLPCVGITLPFYSAGGSSNLCLYVGIGLILSIYRHSYEGNTVNFTLSKLSTPFTE